MNALKIVIKSRLDCLYSYLLLTHQPFRKKIAQVCYQIVYSSLKYNIQLYNFFFFFFTQKRFKEFTVFEDQPDNRRKEKTSCPNIEDRKRGFRVTSQLAVMLA